MAFDGRVRSRADLEDYIAAFNRKDYDRQISYYAPDVRYVARDAVLDTPEKIKDFYADFHTYCREKVWLHDFVMEGDTIAVSLPSLFEPFRDYTKHGFEFRVGQDVKIVSFAFYTLKDGKIWRIRTARYNGPFSDYADPATRITD